MAEAARRMGYGHSSDVVRRLIARPIRMQGAPLATLARDEPDSSIAAEARPSERTEASLGSPDRTAEAAPEVDRLRTEMLLLKAVLQAERRENASLRACIGFDGAGEALAPEARAMRDRWAALVDRLLHAPV